MSRNATQKDALLERICGEFMEMPGLRLTCAQAQRLWGLDEPTCRRVLDALVDARFLVQPATGAYARSTEGMQPRRPGARTFPSNDADSLKTSA
jgi:Fic family protein